VGRPPREEDPDPAFRTPTGLAVVHGDRGDVREDGLKVPRSWSRVARLLEEIDGSGPADRFGGGLVRHPEARRNRPVAQAKLSKMQGFPGDPLVGGRLQCLGQRHFEWQGPRGSNTLRSGPPNFFPPPASNPDPSISGWWSGVDARARSPAEQELRPNWRE